MCEFVRMVGNEVGGHNPPTSHKRPRHEVGDGGNSTDCGDGGGGERFDYSPYITPDYKRLYREMPHI